MRILIIGALVVAMASPAVEAGPFRRYQRSSSVSSAPRTTTTHVQSYSPVGQTQVTQATTAGADDALAEVNAARAQRGLRPFLPDPALNQAARACAQVRASRRIEGHLPNDFSYLPSGATARSAGCGAMEPSWGWGTCCAYDNYTYAGAAWVMGSDGKRYMHLFVR